MAWVAGLDGSFKPFAIWAWVRPWRTDGEKLEPDIKN